MGLDPGMGQRSHWKTGVLRGCGQDPGVCLLVMSWKPGCSLVWYQSARIHGALGPQLPPTPDLPITMVSSEFLWLRGDQTAQVFTIKLPFSPFSPSPHPQSNISACPHERSK